MQTKIHPDLIGLQEITEADRILRSCVHCGFCTAVCPTYQMLGDELDGPRGRIYLIKDMLEENRVSRDATRHIDRCLTCRACEAACPSGVEYGWLLDIGRAFIAERQKPRLTWRVMAAGLRAVVPRPALFTSLLRLGQSVRALLPPSLKNTVPQRQKVRAYPVSTTSAPAGQVVILQGCVQRATTPNVNRAFEYLLSLNNIGFQYAPGEGCCGAVDLHLSAHDAAVDRMKALIDRLWPYIDNVDAIVSTASGCGLTIKEYPRVIGDDPVYAERAARIAEKVVDASEFLADVTFECEPAVVAFQSPCSLQHGRRLDGKVESILRRAGMTLTEVPEPYMCCGS
ncbi:MAG TPA: glycolate oxidase subunit GlcF, partial [Pseudomonadales bacterium]|nr:glycolate oxidase subunit GlcF [Pseudomonadales bacterium]